MSSSFDNSLQNRNFMCSFHNFCDEGELMLSLEGHQPHFLISLGSREIGQEEIHFLVGKIRKSTTPLLAWHSRCCPMGALGSEPPASSWHDRGLSRAGLPVPCPVQSLPTGMEAFMDCQPTALAKFFCWECALRRLLGAVIFCGGENGADFYLFFSL